MVRVWHNRRHDKGEKYVQKVGKEMVGCGRIGVVHCHRDLYDIANNATKNNRSGSGINKYG